MDSSPATPPPAPASLSLEAGSLLWLLQVNDSQFPSGSYAHSLGLEGVVQRGLIRKPDDLEAFIHEQIIPSLLSFEIPYLVHAHHLAGQGDMNALRAWDETLDAWKLADELRQASRQMGSRRLAMLGKLESGDNLLRSYDESGAPCHHLIVCALELRGLPAMAAASAFTYQSVSGQCMAAMKLIRLGQERCQGILRGALQAVESRLPETLHKGEDFGWFNPLLEIASMRHARANERLFIS